MRRRTFLASTAALAMPAIAHGEASQVLKFVPQADLAVLDPIWTTTYQTRDHGFLVFDTLFGLDGQYRPQPQMAEAAGSSRALRRTYGLRYPQSGAPPRPRARHLA